MLLVLLNSAGLNSLTTVIIIVLAVIIVMMIVLIVIVGLLIGACWKIRRSKSFASAEPDENYGYATIDKVAQGVLTKANQAYAAADHFRAESFDKASYNIADAGMGTGHFQRRSTFDKDSSEVIDDKGTLDESAQHKQVLQREKAFDRDAYEVIDVEDNLGTGERTAQLMDINEGSSENMKGADESKMKDVSEEDRREQMTIVGQSIEKMSGAKDEQGKGIDEEYVKMDAAPCERTLTTKEVQNEANDSTLEAAIAETGFELSMDQMLASTSASESFDLVENDAYSCNIAKPLGTYENTYDAGWIHLEVWKTKSNPESMTTKLSTEESRKMSML